MARRENRAATQFAKLREETERLNESIRDLITSQEDAAEAAATNAATAAAEAARANAAAEAREIAANTRRADAEAARRKASERELEAIKERIKLIKQEADGASNVFDKTKAILELQEENLNLLKKERQKRLEKGDDLTDIENQIKKNIKATEQLNKINKENNENLEKAKQAVDGIENGLMSIAKGDFTSGFTQIGKSLNDMVPKLFGNNLKAKTKDYLTNALSSFGQQIPQVAEEAGSVSASMGSVAVEAASASESISTLTGAAGGAAPALTATGTAAGGAGAGMTTAAAGAAPLAVGLGTVAAALVIVLPLLIALAVAIGVTVKIAQFALELENSARQLTKVSGLSKDFSHAMHENADSLREFGASAEDINSATIALNATFTDFSLLNTAAASKVKDTTVVLGKLGMSADDTAKGFQALSKGFAQTPEQAANSMLELDAIARDLDVSTAKMGADFAGASVQLQKLSGPQAMQAFKQLAVVSKATGIEVSRLLAITEKFDTFEGAATQAGKLNAALGGNFVNAMELMTATNPVERFEMIRDSILDSGLAFDEMSYYQKKFFADAAGMADVGELAMAMSGDFGAVGAEVGKTQADYEAAAKRAREFQSVQEQLANTMQSLVPVVKPLIKFIGEATLAFSEFVLEYKDEIQAMFKGLMYFTAGLALYFAAMNIPIIATVAVITAMSAGIAYLLGLLGDLAAGLTGVREATSVDHSSPTLLGGLEEMASSLGGVGDGASTAMGSVDKLKAKMSGFRKELFSGDDNLVAGVKMTAEGMEGVGDASAKTAATMRATAPTIANNTAIRNVANNTANKNNTNSTTYNSNNNTSDNKPTAISIKFDNKKFADLFDVQVEKSIGRAARKAVV